MKLQFCLAAVLLLCLTSAEGKCTKGLKTKFKDCLTIGYQPKHFQSCKTKDADISRKDKQWCRKIERKLKNKCSFTCAPSLMLGGITEVKITDNIRKVGDVAVREFINRALKSGNFGSNMSVVQGDVTKAMVQVVAGRKYFITMELGVTNKTQCKQASKGRIVSKDECSDEASMGTYKFILVHAAWQKPEYNFWEFLDVSGTAMRDLYWVEY